MFGVVSDVVDRDNWPALYPTTAPITPRTSPPHPVRICVAFSEIPTCVEKIASQTTAQTRRFNAVAIPIARINATM